jgi:hypothetical protein
MNKIIKWSCFAFLATIISTSVEGHQLKNAFDKIKTGNVLTTSDVAETIFVHRGEKVKVKFDKDKAIYQIRIHNPVGRIIGRFKTISSEFVVETKSWNKGIYFIVISNNVKYKERKKVVVSA